MVGRAAVYGAAPAALILRNMWRYLSLAQVGYEFTCVVGLVSTKREPAFLAWQAVQHPHRRLSLCPSRCRREVHIHHEPIAVLHEHVAGEAELGLLAAAFACQKRFRVCRRGVRFVTATLASVIHIRVLEATARRTTLIIPRPYALQRCPGLE